MTKTNFKTVFAKMAARVGVGVMATVWVSATTAWAALPIEHWVREDGVRVYLVQSMSIPMLDVQIDFDGGQRRDPASQVGLAQASAAMTARGVTAQGKLAALDENALSQAWADLGAQFGASASEDRLSFSLRTLTETELLDQAVALAARQLAQPSLPAKVWVRDRERWVNSLKEAYTRPGPVAERAFAREVYAQHPYGYEETAQSLGRIDVADMRAYLKRTVQRCDARVSLVGAVDKARADALVERLLAWVPKEQACVKHPAVAEVQALTQAKVERIPFKSAQTHVLIGQPGFKRDDPDFFPLIVGNYILGGGGFVSRLTEQIREKRGLSYSVYSYFSPGLHAGAFTVGLQTRPDQADQAVQLVFDVVKEFVQAGPTQQELDAAKANLINGFALRIDSNRKLLDNVANIAWHGLPLTYLDTWTQQVQRVTVEEIRAAFQRKLQPEKMVTVVVGGAS